MDLQGAGLGDAREVVISLCWLGWFMFPCLHPSCSSLCKEEGEESNSLKKGLDECSELGEI